MKINTSEALKAGLIGAVAGLVAAFITSIPVLGCLVTWLGPAVGLATGALYVHLAGRASVAEGAAGGAVTGAVAGIAYAILSGILSEFHVSNVVFGTISAAVLGAIGGLIYALIKNR